jgi:hypothetical protein
MKSSIGFSFKGSSKRQKLDGLPSVRDKDDEHENKRDIVTSIDGRHIQSAEPVEEKVLVIPLQQPYNNNEPKKDNIIPKVKKEAETDVFKLAEQQILAEAAGGLEADEDEKRRRNCHHERC